MITVDVTFFSIAVRQKSVVQYKVLTNKSNQTIISLHYDFFSSQPEYF